MNPKYASENLCSYFYRQPALFQRYFDKLYNNRYEYYETIKVKENLSFLIQCLREKYPKSQEVEELMSQNLLEAEIDKQMYFNFISALSVEEIEKIIDRFYMGFGYNILSLPFKLIPVLMIYVFFPAYFCKAIAKGYGISFFKRPSYKELFLINKCQKFFVLLYPIEEYLEVGE